MQNPHGEFTTLIEAKSALGKTAIPGFDYCLNPYIGCMHGCRYCYASFMKRFTNHSEAWGAFLDVRINLPHVLMRELRRKPKGSVVISSVTDPYQPAEAKYKITRQCLELLAMLNWSVSILTKSTLVTRDIDIFQSFKNIEVGMTITTDSESIRRIFEPGAPPLEERKKALLKLTESGIKTYVFVGPILPITNPHEFARELGEITDSILLDRMNYLGKVRELYRQKSLSHHLENEYFESIESVFKEVLGDKAETVCPE